LHANHLRSWPHGNADASIFHPRCFFCFSFKENNKISTTNQRSSSTSSWLCFRLSFTNWNMFDRLFTVHPLRFFFRFDCDEAHDFLEKCCGNLLFHISKFVAFLFIALVDKLTHPRNKKGVISSLVLRRCCRPTIRIFPSFRLPKKNPPPTNRYGHNKQKRAETASSANANKVGDDWRWWWWSSLLIIFHQQLSKPSSWRKKDHGTAVP
jgi:hypothetical protein